MRRQLDVSALWDDVRLASVVEASYGEVLLVFLHS